MPCIAGARRNAATAPPCYTKPAHDTTAPEHDVTPPRPALTKQHIALRAKPTRNITQQGPTAHNPRLLDYAKTQRHIVITTQRRTRLRRYITTLRLYIAMLDKALPLHRCTGQSQNLASQCKTSPLLNMTKRHITKALPQPRMGLGRTLQNFKVKH